MREANFKHKKGNTQGRGGKGGGGGNHYLLLWLFRSKVGSLWTLVDCTTKHAFKLE